jgi:hypothetical protein
VNPRPCTTSTPSRPWKLPLTHNPSMLSRPSGVATLNAVVL